MDQFKNPFDESVSEVPTNPMEADKNPFDDASATTVVHATRSIEPPTVIKVDIETETKNESEVIDSDYQPKPEFPQGLAMQTQGQPFVLPQGSEPVQGQPQGFNPQQPQNPGFAPQEQPPQQPQNPGFAPQEQPPQQPQNPGFAPQEQPPQQNQPPQQQPPQQQPQNPGFAPQQNQNGGFNPQQNQQQNGGGFPQNQSGGFNPQQNNGGGGFPQKEKYAIVDMFWFVNKKLYAAQALDQGEAQLLTIGFNASFNNLRIGLRSDNGGAFTDSSIIIGNCAALANFNIFSEHALQIISGQPNVPIRIFERVISAGGWTPNQSEITNNATSFLFKSTNAQSGNAYMFNLVDEQVLGFQRVLEFLLNGQAWNMALTGVVNR